jgi:hypothetical protein
MALGRTGQPFARLVVGACLAFVLLLLGAPGIAVADNGDYLESFGPDGTTGTEFERPAGLAVDQETGAVYVYDSEVEVLYKFDEEGNPLDWGGSAGYISGNELTGVLPNPVDPNRGEVAADPETHVVYVTSDNKVRAFEANGEPHTFTAGPGEGTNELPGATELYGVTVDKFGDIYTSDIADKKVRIYSRSGAAVAEFEPVGNLLSSIRPAAMAVAPDGTLYISAFLGTVYAFEPSKFPVTSETTYGLGQPLQPASDVPLSGSVAVDPLTEYVYIGEQCPGGSCSGRVSIYDELGKLVGFIGAEGPGQLGGAPPGVGADGTNGKLYAVVRGEGSALAQVSVFEAFQFPKGPPTIFGPSITNISSTTAELRARINPNTLETTYWFEYGTVDCEEAPGSCTKVPATPTSIGSGHVPVLVTRPLSGLTPGTHYFVQVVAENGFEPGNEPVVGYRAFTTQAANFESKLGDGRVWELVTPTRKFGGVMTNGALVQADPDGSGIAFQTRGSIVEDPEGNRALETSAALARRSGSGWIASDLVPRHTEAGGLGFGPEFKMFSTDLGKALLEPRDDTPLSPEASERGPYLQTNTEPPSYRPLVTTKEPFANVPSGTVFGGEATGERNPVAISGANPSLTHVVVSSKAALVPGAESRSLYLWSDGAIEPVSELPAGEGGGIVTAEFGSGALSVRNAVSEDGSRVFWAAGYPLFPNLDWPALYLRDTVADETFRIDEPAEGASGEGDRHPAFMTASADGSVVFFTDSQQLTEDASPDGRDLYRCEIGDLGGGSLGCVNLEDLSVPVNSGESGEAEELAVGTSEDGGSLYFIARGVLDPEENESGEEAEPGAANLYVWEEGFGVRFIATLSEEDAADWGSGPPNPVGQAARGAGNSSPDGRYLSFMSQENLAGAETADPNTGEPVEHAFLYDSVEEQLVCISCNPSGATDPGHLIVKNNSEGGVIFPDRQQLWSGRLVGATLPETTEGEPNIGYALYWPRGVLDNGRAYFNSTNPLVNGDSNGTWDVYQYEPFGVGDCDLSAGSAMVATTETGCVALMSSGTDSLPSVFLDASASGDDVFLATFAQLSALDTDTNVDIYDARVGGVEAVVEPPPAPCAGEACQGSETSPGRPPMTSATFNGAGNVNQKPHKHCRKGQKKVKRHGKVKCVKKHQKHKQHKQSSKSGKGA